MTCDEFLESIEDLALGSAGPDRSGALRAHAASCPACAARLAETEGLNARLRGLRTAHSLPPGLRDRVLDTIVRAGDGVSVAPFATRLVRLWRWAPAAAALLLVAAFAALFVSGPGPAVPAVVADTLVAYDGLAARGSALDVRSSSAETVQTFFRDRLQRDVPAPCVHAGCTCPPGACPCGLVGGCICDVPAAGGRVPIVLYNHQGTTLALLVVDPVRLGPGVLAAARPVADRGHSVRVFESRGLSAAVCPDCNPGHLWVSRLPRQELVEAFHAAQAGRSSNGSR